MDDRVGRMCESRDGSNGDAGQAPPHVARSKRPSLETCPMYSKTLDASAVGSEKDMKKLKAIRKQVVNKSNSNISAGGREEAEGWEEDEDDIAVSLSCCSKLRRKYHFKPAIPTSEEELSKVEKLHGEKSWKFKAVKFVNSGPIQKLLIGLLLCDVLILFVELYLDAAYPSCHTISRDAISCCPADCGGDGYGNTFDDHSNQEKDDDHHGDDKGHRALGGSEYGYCGYPYEDTSYPASCDDHKYEAVHTAHDVLFGFTIGILSTFMVEILILIVSLGPCLFFSRFLYVLDFLVVGSSLALETVFATMDDQSKADVAGLLVVFRLWRFLRIGHGLVSSTHEMAEQKMDKLKKYTRELEKEVIRCGGVLPESNWSLGLLMEQSAHGESADVSVRLGRAVVSKMNLMGDTDSSRSTKESGSTLNLIKEEKEQGQFIDEETP